MLRLIAAGLVSLPVLGFSVVCAVVVGVLSLPSVALLKFRKGNNSKNDDSHSSPSTPVTQHAIITGGSSGIGLAIAKECVKKGMDRVTILARTQSNLNQCQMDLQALTNTSTTKTKIQALSVDVTDANALKAIAAEIFQSKSNGKVFVFCCAGTAKSGRFGELSPTVFAEQMQTNYLGTVYAIHAFLPHMSRGTLVMTSSAAGQVGVYGFSAYSPTKFALRGFAECLHMELIHKDIHVQLVFPPDTDTPGYHAENKDKPHETHLISSAIVLMQPEQVASHMVREATRQNPKFAVNFALVGWMLGTLTAGMSPESSLVDVATQVTLMGLMRLVGFFFLTDFWRTITKYQTQSATSQGNSQNYGSIEANQVVSVTGQITTSDQP